MIQIRYWIEEYRKKIFIVLGFFFILCLIGFGYFYFDSFSLKKEKKKVEEFPIEIKEAKEEKEPKKEEEKEEKAIPKLVTVDIKGAITSPGVYEVEEGSRVQDVIRLANGLVENADVSLINLSKKVEDEMVIVIYTKEEILAFKEKNNASSSTTPIIECPEEPIINDACITNEKSENQESVEGTKVSINQSDLKTLMTLPGIGESKAQAIISYREQNGGFQSLEQLKNVSGIGEAVYAKLEPFIIL